MNLPGCFSTRMLKALYAQWTLILLNFNFSNDDSSFSHLIKDTNINAANYKTRSHKNILYCLNFDSTITKTEGMWRQRRESDGSALVNLWLFFVCLFYLFNLFCSEVFERDKWTNIKYGMSKWLGYIPFESLFFIYILAKVNSPIKYC